MHWILSHPNHAFWFTQMAAEIVLACVLVCSPTAPPWFTIYCLFDLLAGTIGMGVDHFAPHTYVWFWVPKQYLLMAAQLFVVAEGMAMFANYGTNTDCRIRLALSSAATCALALLTAPAHVRDARDITIYTVALFNLIVAFYLCAALFDCRYGSRWRMHCGILMAFSFLNGLQYLVAPAYQDIGRGLMLGDGICYCVWAFLFWPRNAAQY